MIEQNTHARGSDASQIGGDRDQPLPSSSAGEPDHLVQNLNCAPDAGLPSGRVLAIVTGCLIFGLFLTFGVAIQLLNPAFGIWFTEVFIFFGVAWVMVRLSGRDPVRYAGISFPGWRPIWFGFALGAVNFFAIVVPIQFAAQSIAPLWLREQFDMSHLLENQTPWELAALIGGVGLAAPFCEEFVFRGVLQQGLMSSSSHARRAIAWTAVIFSAAHLDPVGFSARLELGVLFGILFWKTGTIWPGAMAHAANNLVSTGIYFAVKGARADVEDPHSWWSILVFAAIGNTLLFWLISLARKDPTLLPVRSSGPGVNPLDPRPSLFALARLWMVAAVGSLLAYGLANPRGLALSLYDVKYPVRSHAPNARPEEKTDQEELQRSRFEARRGNISIEEYVRRRKELFERQRSGAAALEKPEAPH